MVGGLLLICLIEYIPYFMGIGPGMDLLFTSTFGGHQAELNIFYGKKGFSVVKSTKTACSDELNDLVYNLVMELIVY